MIGFAFHPEADEEFVETVAYYEECETGPGLDFARQIHAAIDEDTSWRLMPRSGGKSPVCGGGRPMPRGGGARGTRGGRCP